MRIWHNRSLSLGFMPVSLLRMALVLLVFLSSCTLNRKYRTLWTDVGADGVPSTVPGPLPGEFSLFKFDTDFLKDGLKDAGASEEEGILVQLPDPGGDVGPFKIWQSKLVSPKLLEKYPGLAAYKGFRTSEVSTRVRLELPDSGMQVMVSGIGETWYISPYNAEEDIYMLYYRSSLAKENTFWEGKTGNE